MQKDPLSLMVFEEAGQLLAQHILALLPKSQVEEVPIICVGSVFKSWPLLEGAFLQKIGFSSKKIYIRCLTKSSAIGAAFFAAKSFNLQLPIDFSKNYKELCCYKNGKIIQ